MRTAHQGEKSALALANREIGALPPSAKAEAGKRVGQARGRVARPSPLARPSSRPSATSASSSRSGSTSPCRRCGAQPGARHPIELVAQRLVDAFVGMGWEVAEGPELESEWLNFDALNLGPDHPARQMQDTFFLDPVDSGLVLRTQTSPVQIRTMLEQEPPIYVVAPGKVFRTDDLDATHTPVFHQIECLAIDKGLTMAHLRGALDAFVRIMFGEETRTRVRANYFPFTEPSMETDFLCFACHGAETWGSARAVPHLRRLRLDRARRLRHGQPQGAAHVRHRPRRLLRVRVRARHREGAACCATACRACTTWSRATCASRSSSGWGSDMRMPLSWLAEYTDLAPGARGADVAAGLVSRRSRGGGPPRRRHHRARSSSGACSTFALEPQKNGKTIRWCTVDVGQNGQMLTEGKHQEIVCGAHNFEVGDLVVVVAARCRAARAASRSPRARPTATSPTA